jgi:hypothetical protein
MQSKFDVVDVSVSSTEARVDAILQDPLLDGTKRYSIEVSEFATPLSSESPLPSVKTFADNQAGADNMFIFRVRRKLLAQVGPPVVPGTAALHQDTLLSFLPVIGGQFPTLETFRVDAFRPMRTPNDMAFYLQEYFNEIKAVYVNNAAIAAVPPAAAYAGGLIGDHHGGVADVTQVNMEADRFVQVILTPNGTIRFYFSQLFTRHFFIEATQYGMKLLGLKEDIIAFRTTAAVPPVVLTGIEALYDPAVGGGVVVAPGEVARTTVLQCSYPLTRHFDHRVRLEIDSSGMPVPPVVSWTTDNKQKVRNTIASFSINQKYQTGIELNTLGANEGGVSFTTNMFLGSVVWRRAENKVSERYEILNSQWFQNIRLEVYMVRRNWVANLRDPGKFIFNRQEITLADGESWTAKLRFRTF